MAKISPRQRQLNNLRNDHGFEDRFFDNFDAQFEKSAKRGVAGVAGIGCLMLLVNAAITLTLLAGAVWVVVKVLQHLGVI